MNWLKKGRRQFIIFGITILFAAFLIQLNQVEREGLYETEGKTFEKAKVVEIKKDNTTESGNQIGNQLVSLRLLSGKFRGTVVEAVSSSGYLYGTHCEKGMKVIAEVNEGEDSLHVTVYSYDRTAILCNDCFAVFADLKSDRREKRSLFRCRFDFLHLYVLYFLFFATYLQRGISCLGSSAGCNSDEVVTMYLLGGISSKSVTAVVGTVLGVGISGILAILFGKWTHISGYNVADIEQLT